MIEFDRKSDQNDEPWKKRTSARILKVEILVYIISIILMAISFNYSSRSAADFKREIEESIMTKIDARIEMLMAENVHSKMNVERDERDERDSPVGIHSFSQLLDETTLDIAEKLTEDTSLPALLNRNIIELRPENLAKEYIHRMRKLEIQPSCNGTEFHLDLMLDNEAQETFWQLVNKQTNTTVASKRYENADSNTEISQTLCVDPGPYVFSLFDSGGDGISCQGGRACYNISSGEELLIEGKVFNKKAEHYFDSSTSCWAESMFLMTIQSKEDLSDLNLKFQDSETLLELERVEGLFSVSFSRCIPPGLYNFVLEDNTGMKYSCSSFDDCNVFIDNEIVFERSDLTNILFSFSISNLRSVRVRSCLTTNVLSPINRVNNYMYDERLGKILDVIHGLSSLIALNDPNSPQYKATCWITYDDSLNLQPDDERFLPRYVIAVLLYAMNQNAELLLPMDICEYDIISCDINGQISKLDIFNHNIEGTIPSELSRLLSLKSLNFNKNRLGGNIPPEFSRLINLETLNLANNQFTGTIPRSIGLLFNLKNISLSSNQLTGVIPSGIGKCFNLESINLFDNDLSGTISEEIFEIPALEFLKFSKNRINGTIPSTVGQLHQLKFFLLENNELTGSIPTQIGKLSNVTRVMLSSNYLNGTLPEEIDGLTNIMGLYVDENELTGTIPDSIAKLTQLRRLHIAQNQFSGSIPESLFHIDLGWFIAHGNNLNAKVPDEFCAHNPFTSFDDSPWFRNDPEVNCPCCEKSYCYLWNTKRLTVGGSQRPHCPRSHKLIVNFKENFTIWDTIANVSLFESVGQENLGSSDVCISPTGCYVVENEKKLMYSRTQESLIYQDNCEAVDMCGESFHSSHPKRLGLNHLAQLIATNVSDIEDDSALCWILTEDKLFETFDVCDGTLLQRYVLTMFFRMQKNFEFEEIADDHTCNWPGIQCDSSGKYVEYIELQKNESHDGNSTLNGNLISELGFLRSLKGLNLSGNDFVGTLDPNIFLYLPNLEVFDIGNNNFGGRVPSLLLELDQLRKLNLTGNSFVGTLPDNVPYSKSLEFFDVGNNLLRGIIPNNIFESRGLKHFNISQNFFSGRISSRIGNLVNLEKIDFGNNFLTGSIAGELFNDINIEVLKLQGNQLTGSIPSAIQHLRNVSTVALNHNLLKGTIPTELETLTHIEFLHLESNKLTGIAPNVTFVDPDKNNTYVTDCAKSNLECPNCKICCNHEGKCNRIESRIEEWAGLVLTLFAVPFIFSVFILIALVSGSFSLEFRDPLDIYKEESIYCFLFSRSKVAQFFSLTIAVVQVLLLFMFLRLSSMSSKNSLMIFTVQCSKESMTCIDQTTLSGLGWVLFHVLVILYLGMDVVNGILQMRLALKRGDKALFCCGFMIVGLTSLSWFTSWRFNTATAGDNTDLIMNAVVLLFINDLDEQVGSLLSKLLPNWTNDRYDEVKERLKGKEQEDLDEKACEKKDANLELTLDSYKNRVAQAESEVLNMQNKAESWIVNNSIG